MATDNSNLLKDPAHGGIFCLQKAVIVLLLLLSLNSFSQARLEVTDAKKNFGIVKKGEVVKIVYDLINIGNQPLIINDTEVSCSCTTVEFPAQPVLPGQAAKITVSFDTKSVYNRQDRIVYVNSNDPGSPAKLRYKGLVLKN